jgi:hypothetical protein
MSTSPVSLRDDFPEPTKRILAARVNQRCSNPDCCAQTSGPQIEAGKSLNLGVAAHIAGAAPGGPRYDPAMTSQQRTDIQNGIWLCQNCAKLIDNDQHRFTTAVLQVWKTAAEQIALELIGKASLRADASPVIDKWVNLSYPEKAGIIRGLTADGYDVRWSTANDENERVDLQGWEPVLLEEVDGRRARLKVRDHPAIGGYLILLRKKQS